MSKKSFMFIILIISVTRKDFIDVLEILKNKMNKKNCS